MLRDDEVAEHHRTAVAAFLGALATAPDEIVPFYPTWTVRDLGVHVATVHTMAATAIETAASERPAVQPPVEASEGVDAIAEAIRHAVARLEDRLAEPPAARVWVLLPDRPVAAWRRRMLMEASLHLWDATAATGRPQPPPDDVALDGIDEFLHVHAARALPGAGLTGTVLVDAMTTSWQVELAAATIAATTTAATEDAATTSPTPVVPSGGGRSATVRGAPASLWLWCNRRTPTPTEVHLDDPDGSVARFVAFLDGLGRPAR